MSSFSRTGLLDSCSGRRAVQHRDFALETAVSFRTTNIFRRAVNNPISAARPCLRDRLLSSQTQSLTAPSLTDFGPVLGHRISTRAINTNEHIHVESTGHFDLSVRAVDIHPTDNAREKKIRSKAKHRNNAATGPRRNKTPLVLDIRGWVDIQTDDTAHVKSPVYRIEAGDLSSGPVDPAGLLGVSDNLSDSGSALTVSSLHPLSPRPSAPRTSTVQLQRRVSFGEHVTVFNSEGSNLGVVNQELSKNETDAECCTERERDLKESQNTRHLEEIKVHNGKNLSLKSMKKNRKKSKTKRRDLASKLESDSEIIQLLKNSMLKSRSKKQGKIVWKFNVALEKVIEEFGSSTSGLTNSRTNYPRMPLGPSCRFDLPIDASVFQDISPMDYLLQFSIVSPHRVTAYTEVFNQFKHVPADWHSAVVTTDELHLAMSVAVGVAFSITHVQALSDLVHHSLTELNCAEFIALCALGERVFARELAPHSVGLRQTFLELADFQVLPAMLATVREPREDTLNLLRAIAFQ